MCGAHAAVRHLLGGMHEPNVITVIDMEAGLEHLSRGTDRHVDTLLVVVEPYVKALETARRCFVLSPTLNRVWRAYMKRIMTAVTLAILSSPVSAFACDGSIKCAMRNAPRQALHMLPGFLSTHAGLLLGMVLSAVVLGVIFRREAGAVRKD